MTDKQKLSLLLIATDHRHWDLYTLVKAFDQLDFPANLSADLRLLIDEGYIRVDKEFDNGTASAYVATARGQEYVSTNIDIERIRNYVSAFGETGLILSFIDLRLAQRDGA